MKAIFTGLLAGLMLAGCATSQIAKVGQEVMGQARENAEWTLCVALSMGEYQRAYAADADKAEGWRLLCRKDTKAVPTLDK